MGGRGIYKNFFWVGIIRFYLMDYHEVALLRGTFDLVRWGLLGDTFLPSWLASFVYLVYLYLEGDMTTGRTPCPLLFEKGLRHVRLLILLSILVFC